MIKEINNNDLKKDLTNNKTLVQFHATWCGPCKMLGKVIDEYSNESDMDILRIDIDQNNSLAEEYNIFSVPTLILFDNGKEIKRNVGFIPKDELESWVNDEK